MIDKLKRYDVPSNNTGIYFLYHGDEVVYVGQSTAVWGRINTHKREGEKVFDSFSILPCPKQDLPETELFYIYALQPKYNRRLDGFCNRRIFTKKVQKSFEPQLEKRFAEEAILKSGVKGYEFKGEEYYRSASLRKVVTYLTNSYCNNEYEESQSE